MQVKAERAFFKFCHSCQHLNSTPQLHEDTYLNAQGERKHDDTIYQLFCDHDDINNTLAVMGISRDPTVILQDFTPPTECPYRLEMLYLYGTQA